MQFWEAMKKMQEGRKVFRRWWDASYCEYIYLNDKNNIVDNLDRIYHIDYRVYDDWEVYEDIRENK